MRWVCGRFRRARKLWVVVVSLVAILLLLGKNFRWDPATSDEARNLSADFKNRNLITFVDTHKAFDKQRQRSALTAATSSIDLQQAFDSRRRSRSREKKLPHHLDTKKNTGIKSNDSLNSSDLKKPFDNKKNDSRSKSVDVKKSLNSKRNDSNSVERQKSPETFKLRRLSNEELPKAFAHRLTGQEKAIVFEILQALDTVSVKLQLPYFLCGGTLLGSFRHHDLIPWDDDVDVYMNLTERDSIHSGLSSLSPTFEVFEAGNRLKLYSHWSHASSRYPWKYPYVDINFFFENATHIIDSDPTFDNFAYRKETIFPLHRRPLGGLFPFAPFDTYSYLTHTYTNITLCSTSYYDHRSERIHDNGIVMIATCRRLRHLFAFVYRTRDRDSSGIRETLMISDTVLQTMIVEEPQYVIGSPFSLIPVTEAPSTTRD